MVARRKGAFAHPTRLRNRFAEEGVLRDIHRDADGSFRSMRMMSLLKPEWLARVG
jgi:hypothetical protein